jgi:hypothetical protein
MQQTSWKLHVQCKCCANVNFFDLHHIGAFEQWRERQLNWLSYE